ncbi:hypothetical protein ABK040_014286 [Willaertia magna]
MAFNAGMPREKKKLEYLSAFLVAKAKRKDLKRKLKSGEKISSEAQIYLETQIENCHEVIKKTKYIGLEDCSEKVNEMENKQTELLHQIKEVEKVWEERVKEAEERHKKQLEEAEKKVKEAEEQYKQLMDKVEESHKERIRDMMFNGPNQFNMFLRQSDGMVQTASASCNTPIRNQQNDNFMGNLQQVTPPQQNQQLPRPLLTKEEERLQRIERFLKNNILRDCNRVTEDYPIFIWRYGNEWPTRGKCINS